MGKKLMFKLVGEGVCLIQVNRVASIVYILCTLSSDLSSGHNDSWLPGIPGITNMFVFLGELRWSFCSEDSVFLSVGYKAVGSTTTLTVLRGKVVAKKN